MNLCGSRSIKWTLYSSRCQCENELNRSANKSLVICECVHNRGSGAQSLSFGVARPKEFGGPGGRAIFLEVSVGVYVGVATDVSARGRHRGAWICFGPLC